MLGLIAAQAQLAVEASRLLGSRTREVEGPFFAWRGRHDGADATLVAIEVGGADAAFAAAKLLRRRGAKRLILFTEAEAAPAACERNGWAIGDPVLPARAFDASGLAPLLALTPDAATGMPTPIPSAMLRPCGPVERTQETLRRGAIATFVRPMRCPGIANHLDATERVLLFDGHASGAVDAAAEDDVPIAVVALIAGVVRMSHEAPPPRFAREAAVEEALAALHGA